MSHYLALWGLSITDEEAIYTVICRCGETFWASCAKDYSEEAEYWMERDKRLQSEAVAKFETHIEGDVIRQAELMVKCLKEKGAEKKFLLQSESSEGERWGGSFESKYLLKILEHYLEGKKPSAA